MKFLNAKNNYEKDKKMKNFSLLLVSFLLVGCGYVGDVVAPNQMGVEVVAGAITQCKSPGIHTNWDVYADLHKVSMETLTFSVADAEVATSDNQLVGITITIQARRNGDCDSLKNILTNWPSLLDNNNLQNTIAATANEGIKIGVRQFNLAGLLTDRNVLADTILTALEEDAAEYSVTVVNVTVSNIALNESYVAQLNANAQLQAEIDGLKKEQEKNQISADTAALEQENQARIYLAQLEAEKAKTDVDVEIAEREGKKTAAAQQVYADNPQAFELARLNLVAEILGDKSTVYFLPQGTDLTLLFSPNNAPIVPLE